MVKAIGPRSIAGLAAGLFNLRGNSGRFLMVIDKFDYDLGAWSKVNGLGVTFDTCEYRVGDETGVWSMPGLAKYSKISLSRATCFESRTVQEWLTETSKKPEPLSGSIKLLDWTGIPIVEWTLKAFYPVGWKIGDLDPKAQNVVVETLDIAHTGFLEDDQTLFGLPF